MQKRNIPFTDKDLQDNKSYLKRAIRYEIAYGVSNNRRSWYDNSNAERLGYRPQDDSEPFAEAVLAAEPPGADSLAERYQGGTFCAAEYTAKTPPD